MTTLLLTGFAAWWGTGVDDTLALGLLLKGRRPGVRLAMIVGNVIGVLLILSAASAVVLGAISLAPGLLETRLLGVPIQNLLGIIPIGIGVRSLYLFFTDQDDDDEVEYPPVARWRTMGLAAFVGMQVYLVNSFDDLAMHLGILGGALKPSLGWLALVPLSAYWTGSLLGEVTSVIAADWLARHMQTRRILELIAAVVVAGVGVLVLLGAF